MNYYHWAVRFHDDDNNAKFHNSELHVVAHDVDEAIWIARSEYPGLDIHIHSISREGTALVFPAELKPETGAKLSR